MILWDYKITLHQLPQVACEETPTIQCDHTGQCFVHDACQSGIEKLERLFREQGEEGWNDALEELVDAHLCQVHRPLPVLLNCESILGQGRERLLDLG